MIVGENSSGGVQDFAIGPSNKGIVYQTCRIESVFYGSAIGSGSIAGFGTASAPPTYARRGFDACRYDPLYPEPVPGLARSARRNACRPGARLGPYPYWSGHPRRALAGYRGGNSGRAAARLFALARDPRSACIRAGVMRACLFYHCADAFRDAAWTPYRAARRGAANLRRGGQDGTIRTGSIRRMTVAV